MDNNMTQTIYFDESGFTGSDMFNAAQEYFVYCGIAIDESTASTYLSTFRRQPNQVELKSAKLIKSRRGKIEVLNLFDKCIDDSYFVIYEKQYTATSFIYEYFLEPILRHFGINPYKTGLHRFVAGILYMSMILEKRLWTRFWNDLRIGMHSQQPLNQQFFEPFKEVVRKINEQIEPTRIVFEIILQNLSILIDDLSEIDSDVVFRKWIFDTTLSSLHTSCVHFNSRYSDIELFCDDSKPLLDTSQHYYDLATGQVKKQLPENDPHYIQPVNIKRPISFLSSASSSGIQVADILAGAIRYVRENPDDEWSEKLLHEFGTRVQFTEIAYQKWDIDFDTNSQAMKNFAILVDIHTHKSP